MFLFRVSCRAVFGFTHGLPLTRGWMLCPTKPHLGRLYFIPAAAFWKPLTLKILTPSPPLAMEANGSAGKGLMCGHSSHRSSYDRLGGNGSCGVLLFFDI